MKKGILTLLGLIISLTLLAQPKPTWNVTGVWKGYQLQNDGGPFDRYNYEMTLTQTDKTHVTGITYCSVKSHNGEEMFVKIRLRGTLKDGILWFEETDFLTDSRDDELLLDWCKCKGGMKIMSDGSKVYMIGLFSGVTADGAECIPGSVYLEKSIIRA